MTVMGDKFFMRGAFLFIPSTSGGSIRPRMNADSERLGANKVVYLPGEIKNPIRVDLRPSAVAFRILFLSAPPPRRLIASAT